VTCQQKHHEQTISVIIKYTGDNRNTAATNYTDSSWPSDEPGAHFVPRIHRGIGDNGG
jgi:hypothetical protein